MTRRIAMVGIPLVVLTVAAASLLRSSGVTVQVAVARHEPIEEYVDEQGKTRLPQTYTITMPFAGRVETIQLEEGDRVKQDAIVARISTADVSDSLAAARAAVERLDASIKRNDEDGVEQLFKQQADRLVESMDKVVQAADSRVTAGKERFEKTQIFLKRVRDMVRNGGATQTDLDQAELNFVESQANHRQSLLISESMRAIQAATLLLPGQVSEQLANKKLTRAVLEKEREEVAAQLRQVETRLQRSAMHSPVDGIVLNRLVRDEQFLAAGTPLLRIGQLERLEVEADILSRDAIRVRKGDPTEIYGPALARPLGRGIGGSVVRVHPSGFTKVSSLGIEQQRVKVIVQFDREDTALDQLLSQRTLGVDYRVRVRITSKRKENALVVPRGALFRGSQDRWQLFVVRGDHIYLQRVELGLQNDERVEIRDGIRDGDRVVLAPENSLTAGTRVVPERE